MITPGCQPSPSLPKHLNRILSGRTKAPRKLLDPRAVLGCADAQNKAMDPSQRPTSNPPPNPYGQPQAPAYGYPYGQAPPAQYAPPPQQAYYQTPSTQADVFAALAQAPPVYAPPPAPVYVAPPAPPAALASAKFGDETWRISGSDYLGLDLFRSLTDDKGLVISHVPAKCVAWLPASESDFFDDAGRPAALYKIRYTGGELVGDHEDLEAHEIEQSKPMTAKELARAKKDDDDSVKSKASKFVRPSA